MIKTLFGTDGVRGRANRDPMTAEIALKIGMAAGGQFLCDDRRHMIIIGKDTRLSGYLLEPALTAGFIAVGMDVVLLGPLPTPAVALLTRSLRADLGVMISASHNSYEDNGIKLFGPDGFKLSDKIEAEIEERINNGPEVLRVSAEALGRARRLDDAAGRYIEFAKATFPRGLRLDGLRIVLDCANGAAYKVAPQVLWELGAEVVTIGVEPDGLNINLECGSQHTDALRSKVIASHANLGIALDGDADRVVLCDENGVLINGDQLLAFVAYEWQRTNRLQGSGIVTTVMSNLGLEQHLHNIGLTLIRTQVGDRYVVEAMLCSGCNLGGEPSGHIIFSDYTTTGDGLIAALQILTEIVRSERPASKVANQFVPVPQILYNVSLVETVDAEVILSSPSVVNAVQEGEAYLKDSGRLLVRQSKTEPLIRIMAEGKNEVQIESIVANIIAAIENENSIK